MTQIAAIRHREFITSLFKLTRCVVGADIGDRTVVIIEQNSLTRSGKVIILAVAQRPQECGKADGAKPERHGNEVEEVRHSALWVASGRNDAAATFLSGSFRRRLSPRRSALAITASEDTDMAMAAISGVTWPRTAIGTATIL